ncbi:MAG: ChaN family lipoprotein [Planctomycetes bacterium]|nr:ChaN family lipoprotein [Planctomycetota bacterium]
MRMLLILPVLLFATPLLVLADERETESKDSEYKLEVGYQLKRAEYSREFWVGLPGSPLGMGEVGQTELLNALASGCDDTTSVAVIRPERLDGDALERETAGVISGRWALWEAASALGLFDAKADDGLVSPRHTRIVLVGVMETCGMALRIAGDKYGLVDGVVLIDPPVDDLPQIDKGARSVGVDVLLHPRGDAEFRREEELLVKRLGPWGPSARVLRGVSAFDGLNERVADAWRQLRAPQAGLENAKGDIRVWGPVGEMISQAVAGRNVVCVGELHGNPGAHRTQLEVLRYLHAQGRPLALSTEQFERDVQAHLDAYLAGAIDEAEFLKKSRPWPNYADYRPLVEFCKANKIPVIAGNIPRPLASRIFKQGVESFEDFSEEEKSWSAAEIRTPPGAYKEKFMGAMGGMGGHSDSLERMYAAQCIKDDTMAESITKWLDGNPDGLVLHINGAFHSAGGLGVPEKLEALRADVRIGLITCVESDAEFEVAPDEWIVKVPASRPMRQAEHP